MRTRACVPPQYGGAPCSQNDRETQECLLKHCPGSISFEMDLKKCLALSKKVHVLLPNDTLRILMRCLVYFENYLSCIECCLRHKNNVPIRIKKNHTNQIYN